MTANLVRARCRRPYFAAYSDQEALTPTGVLPEVTRAFSMRRRLEPYTRRSVDPQQPWMQRGNETCQGCKAGILLWSTTLRGAVLTLAKVTLVRLDWSIINTRAGRRLGVLCAQFPSRRNAWGGKIAGFRLALKLYIGLVVIQTIDKNNLPLFKWLLERLQGAPNMGHVRNS